MQHQTHEEDTEREDREQLTVIRAVDHFRNLANNPEATVSTILYNVPDLPLTYPFRTGPPCIREDVQAHTLLHSFYTSRTRRTCTIPLCNATRCGVIEIIVSYFNIGNKFGTATSLNVLFSLIIMLILSSDIITVYLHFFDRNTSRMITSDHFDMFVPSWIVLQCSTRAAMQHDISKCTQRKILHNIFSIELDLTKQFFFFIKDT